MVYIKSGQSLLYLWHRDCCECGMLLIFLFVDCWNVALNCWPITVNTVIPCPDVLVDCGECITFSYCIFCFQLFLLLVLFQSFQRILCCILYTFFLNYSIFVYIVSLLSFALHNFDHNAVYLKRTGICSIAKCIPVILNNYFSQIFSHSELWFGGFHIEELCANFSLV